MAPKSLPQTGFYPIKGIQAGLDPKTTNFLRKVPQRMEFDTWFTSPELVHVNQRALFFPAFRNFCQAKPDDKFSFFQIAGKPPRYSPPRARLTEPPRHPWEALHALGRGWKPQGRKLLHPRCDHVYHLASPLSSALRGKLSSMMASQTANVLTHPSKSSTST